MAAHNSAALPSPRPAGGAHARWAGRLLVAAVVTGAACAVLPETGVRATGSTTVPADAVAVVNGTRIRRADYERALASIAEDKRDGLTAADRRLALDRLIEEELLIQEGVARGLFSSDRSVRQAAVQAMLTSILAESRSAEPSEDELRRFYEAYRSPLDAAYYGLAPEAVTARELPPPAFDRVRETVLAAWQRRAEDTALTEYLAWLRSDAEIVSGQATAP